MHSDGEPAGPVMRIAFSSCAKLAEDKRQAVWQDMQRAAPDLVVFLGDNVYGRGKRLDLKYLKKRYSKRAKLKSLRALLYGRSCTNWAGAPFLAVWDDNDFGLNDGYGAEVAPAYVARTTELFLKHCVDRRPDRPWRWTSPVDPSRGLYGSLEMGDVRIVLLDTRSRRTCPSRPSATLLGAAQEAWFYAQLDARAHRATIVCAGSTLTSHKSQSWCAYHDAWNRLNDTIKPEHRVVFLTGDVHENAVVDHGAYFEVVASGAGRKKLAEGRKQVLRNWGQLDIDRACIRGELFGVRSSDRATFEIDLAAWKLRTTPPG